MHRAMLLLLPLALVGLALLAAQPRLAGAQQGVGVQVLGRGLPPEAGGQQLSLLRATF